MDISLQLFGDSKQYPNANIQIKLQSRILTSFLNGILDHKNSESELFLQEVMVRMVMSCLLLFIYVLDEGNAVPKGRYDVFEMYATVDLNVKTTSWQRQSYTCCYSFKIPG